MMSLSQMDAARHNTKGMQKVGQNKLGSKNKLPNEKELKKSVHIRPGQKLGGSSLLM